MPTAKTVIKTARTPRNLCDAPSSASMYDSALASDSALTSDPAEPAGDCWLDEVLISSA